MVRIVVFSYTRPQLFDPIDVNATYAHTHTHTGWRYVLHGVTCHDRDDRIHAPRSSQRHVQDFGEYLPFDAVLYDDSLTPTEQHNRFPELWAQTNEMATSTRPDVVYFMRSANSRSPKHTRLYWSGDQLVTFDTFDGMSVVIIRSLDRSR